MTDNTAKITFTFFRNESLSEEAFKKEVDNLMEVMVDTIHPTGTADPASAIDGWTGCGGFHHEEEVDEETYKKIMADLDNV